MYSSPLPLVLFSLSPSSSYDFISLSERLLPVLTFLSRMYFSLPPFLGVHCFQLHSLCLSPFSSLAFYLFPIYEKFVLNSVSPSYPITT